MENKLYKFIELNNNELPYQDCKIFPELQVEHFIIAEMNRITPSKVIFMVRTYVPIIRNEIKYLILYMRKFYIEDIKDINDKALPKEYEDSIIKECLLIQEKYIIDGLENVIGAPLGGYVTIWKYKGKINNDGE